MVPKIYKTSRDQYHQNCTIQKPNSIHIELKDLRVIYVCIQTLHRAQQIEGNEVEMCSEERTNRSCFGLCCCDCSYIAGEVYVRVRNRGLHKVPGNALVLYIQCCTVKCPLGLLQFYLTSSSLSWLHIFTYGSLAWLDVSSKTQALL